MNRLNKQTLLPIVQSYSWDNSQVEEKTDFSMYILVTETDVKYQQMTEIEKEEVVVLTGSKKEMSELIEGLSRIQLHNKKKIQIHRKKRGRINRQRKKIAQKIRQWWIREYHHNLDKMDNRKHKNYNNH